MRQLITVFFVSYLYAERSVRVESHWAYTYALAHDQTEG